MSWNWSFRWLWADTWVPETKLKSLTRETSILNHWATTWALADCYRTLTMHHGTILERGVSEVNVGFCYSLLHTCSHVSCSYTEQRQKGASRKWCHKVKRAGAGQGHIWATVNSGFSPWDEAWRPNCSTCGGPGFSFDGFHLLVVNELLAMNLCMCMSYV